MASVGDRLLCENCGNFIGYWKKNSVGETKPPDNAIVHSYLGFAPSYFCRKGCKEEWKAKKDSSKSSSGSQQNTHESNDSYTQSAPEVHMTPEQIQAQAEAEAIRIRAEEEVRRAREQQEKEELENDKAKAKELKAEGKKWLALWTSVGKNGRYGIGIGIVVSWFGVFGAPGAIKILLLLVGIAGVIFAGLVVKDSMKN